jgi:hypothetical protein
VKTKYTILSGMFLAIIMPINLIAGASLLFFQFTQYSLRNFLNVLLAPIVVFIHLVTIVAIIWTARKLLQGRLVWVWLPVIPLIPSLVSGVISIAFGIAFSVGIFYAEGCGTFAYKAVSPSGEKSAILYSGEGPAGFGKCDYVYVYYRRYPLIRRDVYRSSSSIDLSKGELIQWKDESTIYLTWDETQIDLTQHVGDFPLWLFFLK